MKRTSLVAICVLAVALASPDAHAQYQEVVAASGYPFLGSTAAGWSVSSADGVLHNNSTSPAGWVVPLQFVSCLPPHNWTAYIWVSDGVQCRVFVVPDSATLGPPAVTPLVPSLGPTTYPTQLTIPGSSWSTNYQGAFLYCGVRAGGWIGNVQWTY